MSFLYMAIQLSLFKKFVPYCMGHSWTSEHLCKYWMVIKQSAVQVDNFFWKPYSLLASSTMSSQEVRFALLVWTTPISSSAIKCMILVYWTRILLAYGCLFANEVWCSVRNTSLLRTCCHNDLCLLFTWISWLPNSNMQPSEWLKCIHDTLFPWKRLTGVGKLDPYKVCAFSMNFFITHFTYFSVFCV